MRQVPTDYPLFDRPAAFPPRCWLCEANQFDWTEI